MWMQIQNQKGGKEGKKKCPAGLWNSFPVQCVLQQVALSPPGPSPFSAIPLGWMCNALWRLVAGALGVWGSYLRKRVEMGALLSPACAWVMVTCSMMLGVRWSQWGITTDWCSLESTTPNSCPMWGFRVFLFYVFHVETRDFSFNSSLPSTLSAMTAQLLNAYSAFRHCPNRTCDNWAALENSTAACLLVLRNVTARIDYPTGFSLETLRAVLTHTLDSGLSPLPTAGASTVSLLTKVHCCSTSVKLSKRGQLGSDKTSSCVMWKKWMWWCMKCNLCSNISETPVGNSPAQALIDRLSSVC